MNELPKRKSMRLNEYDYSQNGCYFITICTYEKQKLFWKNDMDCFENTKNVLNDCGNMVKKWLKELENKFHDIKICEYVIMPEHVHFMLMKTGDHIGSPLRDNINWFKTMTANEYIANVKKGKYPPFYKKVWQRGYYDHVIRNEADYMEKAEYISNNALKLFHYTNIKI